MLSLTIWYLSFFRFFLSLNIEFFSCTVMYFFFTLTRIFIHLILSFLFLSSESEFKLFLSILQSQLFHCYNGETKTKKKNLWLFRDFQVIFNNLKKCLVIMWKKHQFFANVFTNFFLYITMFVWRSISQYYQKNKEKILKIFWMISKSYQRKKTSRSWSWLI